MSQAFLQDAETVRQRPPEWRLEPVPPREGKLGAPESKGRMLLYAPEERELPDSPQGKWMVQGLEKRLQAPE